MNTQNVTRKKGTPPRIPSLLEQLEQHIEPFHTFNHRNDKLAHVSAENSLRMREDAMKRLRAAWENIPKGHRTSRNKLRNAANTGVEMVDLFLDVMRAENRIAKAGRYEWTKVK